VGLGGRVADLRDALGARGRQQRRFGSGHGSLVEIHRSAPQPVGRFEDVVRPVALPRAQPPQRVHVRADGAPRGKIAARRRDVRLADARQQRTEQQHRAAQPAHERAVGRVCPQRLRPDLHRGGADAFDVGPEVHEQPRHHLHVADARHVGEHALLFGEEARREQRQRGVLVAFHGHPALEPVAAFDEEG
jgi:hypothetical protein